jgi:pimeloyl-ACP methyl ester carboxylesterase
MPARFRLDIPEDQVRDLRERLARTRWPDEPPVEPWSAGASGAYMRELVAYWREGFDWRRHEARINSFQQYKVRLRGIDVHFIHQPGEAGAMPLLLSHGWPGSIVEFLELIPLLGKRFSIVAPSLPGYTLSFTPGQPRFGVEEIAEVFVELMTGVLCYRRFGAQGGDWGAFITSRIAATRPELVHGIHLNLLALRRDPKIPAATPEEAAYLDHLAGWLKEETGYQWIQGTKPQTLAYALADSPAGLAAWIAEKFHGWSDGGISRDDMLANISLYWFTGAIGSSFWPYYARMHRPWPIPDGIRVPTGYVEFPKEILRPPRSLAQRTYADIRRWTVRDKGGHFAALETPAVLAEEIKAFFAGL